VANLLYFALGFFVAEFVNLLALVILAITNKPKSQPTKEEWRQY